ncbi:MAG: P-II family nitrogen regulator, partial [Ezakiella massiliensis]
MEATAIYVIVDRGLADDVIEVAAKAGGSGATVLHGRGSGIEKRVAIFDMVIEPEKDIIVLVTRPEKKDGIVDAINTAFDLEKTSKGVIFTMPVTDAVGFNFNR